MPNSDLRHRWKAENYSFPTVCRVRILGQSSHQVICVTVLVDSDSNQPLTTGEGKGQGRTRPKGERGPARAPGAGKAQ